jgi:hypothetical protein
MYEYTNKGGLLGFTKGRCYYAPANDRDSTKDVVAYRKWGAIRYDHRDKRLMEVDIIRPAVCIDSKFQFFTPDIYYHKSNCTDARDLLSGCFFGDIEFYTSTNGIIGSTSDELSELVVEKDPNETYTLHHPYGEVHGDPDTANNVRRNRLRRPFYDYLSRVN